MNDIRFSKTSPSKTLIKMPQRACFLFGGQAALKKKNFIDAYKNQEDYKAIVDYADSLQDIYDLKKYISTKESINENNLILLYCYHIFLFESFKRKIQDPIITSHSFGEYSSLVACKVISFESMLKIIIKRSEYTRDINGFDMYAAIVTKENVEILKCHKDIILCLKNSQNQYIYALKAKDKKSLRLLSEASIKLSKISLDKPYHSLHLNAAAKKLKKYILGMDLQIKAPSFKMLSNVRRDYISKVLSKRELAQLLAKQLTKVIDFPEQMSKLEASKIYEISPRPVLSSFYKERIPVSFLAKELVSNKKRIIRSQSNSLHILNRILGKITGYSLDSITLEDRLQDDLSIDSLKKAEIVFQYLDDTGNDSSVNLDSIVKLSDILNLDNKTKIELSNEVRSDFDLYKYSWNYSKSNPLIYNRKNISLNDFSSNWTIDFNSINYLVIKEDSNLDPLYLIYKKKKQIHRNSDYVKDYILDYSSDSRACQIISAFKAIKKDGLSFDFKLIHSTTETNSRSLLLKESLYPLDHEVLIEGNVRKTKQLERLKIDDTKSLDRKKVLIFGAHSGIACVLYDLLPKENIWAIGRSMESPCADINYISADILQDDFSSKLDKYNFDMIINTTGVELSMSIFDKSFEDFKAEAELNIQLAKTVENFALNRNIEHCIQLSSIVSFFGNRAQSAYCFSKEWINKNCRYSLLLPPLDDIGMTSKKIIRQSLQKSRLPLLSKKEFSSILVTYLSSPHKGETLVFSESDYELYNSPLAPIELKPTLFQSLNKTHSEYTADPGKDLFLKDHKLEANHVFPLAKACYDFFFMSYISSGTLSSLKDVEVFSPIFIKTDPSRVSITKRSDKLSLNAANGSIICYFSAYKPKEIIKRNMLLNQICPYSQRILFHGPYFQKLTKVHLVKNASHASLSEIGDNLKDSLTQIIDCCLQLLALEKSYFEQKKLLPTKIEDIYLNPEKSLCDQLEIRTTNTKKAQVFNKENELILELNGVNLA